MPTAKAIANPHGLPVTPEDRLIEMDVGELEGLAFPEISERYPDLFEKWRGPGGPAYRLPGSSESLADLQVRAREAIEEMLEGHPEDTVVAVTHNFVILALLSWLIGLDLAEFRRLRHSLAAISVVELRPGHVQVISLNDTCHLAGI